MSAVRRCVLYARLSVTKEESVSIDRQLASCRKYAEGRGWEVVGEFVDDGVSATANRPEDRRGWGELLDARDFQAVVVWKIDRLARKVLDFLHVDEVLRDRGAGLVAVEDPIDMTTPMGRAFATILAVFGEMEAAAIASRVKAARAHLVKEGRWTGGGVPYGYQVVDNPNGPGKILAQDPERIGWLTRIVTKAREGVSVSEITTFLDHECAPLHARANITRKVEGGGWNRQTVSNMLRNPVLAGMTPHNPGRKKSAASDPFAVVRDEHGKPVVDESLAILTVDEFKALVADLDNRTESYKRRVGVRQHTSPFLSRVARCDECGVYMCRATNQKKPVLCCPRCRQTLSRGTFDPYLEGRLLAERGDQPLHDATVRDHWMRAWGDERAKRAVLLTQLDSLRIRRGVVGRYFDEDRILLEWKKAAA